MLWWEDQREVERVPGEQRGVTEAGDPQSGKIRPHRDIPQSLRY